MGSIGRLQRTEYLVTQRWDRASLWSSGNQPRCVSRPPPATTSSPARTDPSPRATPRWREPPDGNTEICISVPQAISSPVVPDRFTYTITNNFDLIIQIDLYTC